MAIPVVCPACGGTNKPDAKPMIHREPDGRYSCAYCAALFAWPPPDDRLTDR